MLTYNFPPFCTGEARPLRGPKRREVGHGALARRAVEAVLPSAKTSRMYSVQHQRFLNRMALPQWLRSVEQRLPSWMQVCRLRRRLLVSRWG